MKKGVYFISLYMSVPLRSWAFAPRYEFRGGRRVYIRGYWR